MSTPLDLLAIDEIGLIPLDMVVGNAVFVPLLPGIPANTAEVTSVSQLATKAWDSVLSRLKENARRLGADGVIGVGLYKREVELEGGNTATEFCGCGTAVRGLRRNDIWLTEASIVETSLLLSAGLAPVAIAIGCCTWHESTWNWDPKKGSSGVGRSKWANQEIVPGTRAVYTARAIALERLQKSGRDGGASGIVGVRVAFSKAEPVTNFTGIVAAFEVFGTAVAPGGVPGKISVESVLYLNK